MFVVLNISDSEKHFEIPQQEYLKRLGKTVKIENLKPQKNGTKEQIIKQETENISQKITKKYSDRTKVLLSLDGDSFDTIQLSKLYSQKNKILFLIGGPYGLDESFLCQMFPEIIKISFGKMTMPHPLAKLVLLEQIYRITCIKNGKKYHY